MGPATVSALEDGRIDHGGVRRIGGSDRFETAALLARDGWPNGTVEAVLVTGRNWPDAIAVGPAARAWHLPILLTERDFIPSITMATLRSLNVRHVTVVGGTAVISRSVEQQLLENGFSYQRHAGANRYETAVRVAEAFPFRFINPPVFDPISINIVRGDQFQDALEASSTGRLLLAPPYGVLPDSAVNYLRELKPMWVRGVGDPSLLAATQEQLSGFFQWRSSPEPDPFIRSANGLTDVFRGDPVALVSGDNWPDALAARPWAWTRFAALVLSRRDCIPAALWRRLDALDPPSISIVGGPDALTTNVQALQRC